MRLSLATLLISPIAIPAQSKYDLTGKPDAALQESFTQVAGVRELPANRAIVTDQAERTVYLVDFSSGSRRTIGRQGYGPAEYRFPMAPFPAAGNATLILDATRRLVHVISSDGTFRPSLSPPYVAVPGGLFSVRGVHVQGNIFFAGHRFTYSLGLDTTST